MIYGVIINNVWILFDWTVKFEYLQNVWEVGRGETINWNILKINQVSFAGLLFWLVEAVVEHLTHFLLVYLWVF